MLKRLEVKHFKSLDDFSIDFEPFTVLIGQNGSGKSTVLQAFDLLAAFLKGDVNHYLERKGWSAEDLRSKSNDENQITFVIDFEVQTEIFRWHVDFSVEDSKLQVEFEQLHSLTGDHFTFASFSKLGHLSLVDKAVNTYDLPKIGIRFSQSILRSVKIENAPGEIEAATKALEKIFLLQVDSIDLLRKPSKFRVAENIGSGGEHLASFLNGFDDHEKQVLDDSIRMFIPQIEHVISRRLNGTVWFSFIEKFPNGVNPSKQIEIESNHISDGTLQILALLATIQGAEENQILLLDEIENGIDPNHVSIVVQLLEKAIKEKGIQVILATHSPVVLNYVEENGIRYFSREANGNVVAQNIFDRKEIKNMLEYMGPGEVWLNLTEKDLTKKN